MANFSGAQSLNGLQSVNLFTAPAAGVYFVQANFTLPQLGSAGAPSAAVALLKQNGSTIQTGLAGQSGIAQNQIVCAAGDVIAISLSSAATIDQSLNAVQGQVQFGNTF